MTEPYIPLEQVSVYEGLPYNTLVQKIKRYPTEFKTKETPRECGGRPHTLVALSSLSPKARRKYRAENKTIKLSGGDLTMKRTEDAARPWYLETDYHWYIERYSKQYEKGIELAALMREFTDYCGPDRTGYSVQFAAAHGLTQRTLYRFSQAYLAAGAWAYRMEQETGRNHDFLKVLAMCRKPKEPNTFPSIDPEVKAAIENVWFNEDFRRNRCTVQLLYDELVPKCEEAGIYCPSYQTVTRYVQLLKQDQSAAFLAERGTREWKNRYMFKAYRDLKGLSVMEIVVGDVHTFDLWVKYTPPNGRPIAIRPKMIAWMDMRSRRLVGYTMCRDSNTDDIKNSFAKVVLDYGAPRHLLIDNGKDFANEDTLGHSRKERMLFNADIAGFYKAIGVQEVFRSLPFQPWDKPIERAFRTVCLQLSKRFLSYTGTLTGKDTDDKVRKDIKGMLARNELYTMEEFYDKFDRWITDVYEVKNHRGLADAGEEHTAPRALFERADNRYFRPAPPNSYVAMLLMRAKMAYVNSTGIRHNNETYMCAELTPYIKQHVYIRYQPDDKSNIYAYNEAGELIGEIPLAERLNASFYADEEQVERHKTAQNRQLGAERDKLAAYRLPFGARPENADATPHLVGGVDLIQGKKPERKVISIPIDQEIAKAARIKAEKAREKRTDYLDKRGQAVLDELEKLG